MAVDIRKIKKLIELIEKSDVSEIEIKEGEESIRISKNTSAATPAQQIVHHAPHMMHSHPIGISEPMRMPEPVIDTSSNKNNSGYEIKSPMVGTAYLAPKPGEKPFIEIGQHVSEGDVICLIEAMKMFNQIESDKSGILRARLIENGQPIEYGQPLFIIEPE